MDEPGANRKTKWAAIAFVAWVVAYVTETRVPGMATSQLGSAVIAGTVFAGLAAWIVWGLCVIARMVRNAWRDRARLPKRLLSVAVWGLCITVALLGVCWLDGVVGPLPPGESYHAWLQGVLLGAVAGALFLFVAYWILRAAFVAVVITRGLALIAPLLIWGAFAFGWAPLGWVLVIAAGVIAAGVILGALARA